MSLVIQIRDNKTAFSPGERITGQASWQLDAPPKTAELRLVWSTVGRGIEDMGIVETIPFPNPQATETRPFAFTLPDGPYSFSGKLITLRWSLELAIEPGAQFAGLEIVVAPGGHEVSLPRAAAESSGGS
jgi:hypothetical protein